jgi:hypothetical protein
MSIVLVGSTSGSVTLQEPAVSGSTVLSLPAVSGTLITTGSSGQSIPRAALPAGSVLQVVSSTKTDTFSSSTTGSWLDVTGISVSITPTSSSSKIMIFGRITGMGTNGSTRLQMRLVRDSTAISIGDAAGSRLQVSGNELYVAESAAYLGSIITFLDSPSTTSATTYKIQIRNGNSAGTVYINRTQEDTDSGQFPRGTSSITIMEIAA